MKHVLLLLLIPMALFSLEPLVIGKKITTIKRTLNSFKINIDTKALQNHEKFNKEQALIIDIANNKSLVLFSKRYEIGKKDGEFSWVGESKDKSQKAILSVKNNVLVGTVIFNNAKYKIYPKDKHYIVTKVDTTMAIPYHNDMIMEPKKKIMPTPKPKANKNSIEPQKSSYLVQKSQASSSDSVVTLLIYYTQALKDKYGTNTEAMIQSNIDLAKDAYIDSDTEINLQVVKLKQVTEGSLLANADSSNLNDLLNKLNTDGLVRYERELYGADAVAVFSKYPDSGNCGLGYTPNSATSTLVGAFTAIFMQPPPENPTGQYRYCSDLTFAHELGHNFGCFHDSDHTSDTPMYPYAYGYDIADKFATIMSYDKPEINFFSNPRLRHTDGSPIGNEYIADNARTIKENQYKMADNSEQISEALENGDSKVDYAIDATLNTNQDRDGYIVWLEGTTNFTIDHNSAYSNNPFYLNLYNEDTHQWLMSFNANRIVDLPKARYRISMAFSDDSSGSYYSKDTINYTVDITTEYIQSLPYPSIINYLK